MTSIQGHRPEPRSARNLLAVRSPIRLPQPPRDHPRFVFPSPPSREVGGRVASQPGSERYDKVPLIPLRRVEAMNGQVAPDPADVGPDGCRWKGGGTDQASKN